MNSLNALGNRQIASLQADLAKMENGESGPSVQGKSGLIGFRFALLLRGLHCGHLS